MMWYCRKNLKEAILQHEMFKVLIWVFEVT